MRLASGKFTGIYFLAAATLVPPHFSQFLPSLAAATQQA
jgi:hypothetical protein